MASLTTEPPSLGQICEDLKNADPKDNHHMACLYLRMSIRYYADVLLQAKHSFNFALGAAALGVVFFIGAACRMSMNNNFRWISLVTGALLHVISGTCFYLYGKASVQFGGFHVCLERFNRFTLANNICETLDNPAKTKTRAYLVRKIAEPDLTPGVVTSTRGTAHKSKTFSRSRASVVPEKPANGGQGKTVPGDLTVN